jgi:tetratricopeptide (TPR) repeat protein
MRLCGKLIANIGFAAVIAATIGCVEAPEVGAAAAPNKAKSRGPVMGSATSNEEVAKKVDVLNKLLDGKMSVDQAVERLDKEYKDLDAKEKQKRLASLREAINAITGQVKSGQAMPAGPDRDIIIARLYFAEHRFIEAAVLLSGILDTRDDYPTARNLLARCFYFLGNRDRSIQELEFILKHPRQGRIPGERLDALFLLGAAVAEDDEPSDANLSKAIWAWETYLKEFPESERGPQVQEGLGRLRAKQRGEQPAPQGPGTGPGKAGDRVAKLPADASDFDKALAAGLDALDGKDMMTAESKLNEAIKLKADDPATLVGLGRVYVQTGRIKDALGAFDKAKTVDPAYMPAWHYRGMAFMMGGQAKGAVESWEHILKTDPAYAKQFSLDKRIEVARRMGGG